MSGPGRPTVRLKPQALGLLMRIVIATLALSLVGCGPNGQGGIGATSAPASAPAPVDRKTLRPVVLPDLSKLDAPVQKQLRDGYAALTAKVENSAISDADLGFAYGEMGKLLMAAEYRDGAEPAFLNAEALTPNERRWPYYLAHLYKLKGDATRATASFERALKLKPDDLPTLVWLGGAYLDQDARRRPIRSSQRRCRSLPVRCPCCSTGPHRVGEAGLLARDQLSRTGAHSIRRRW